MNLKTLEVAIGLPHRAVKIIAIAVDRDGQTHKIMSPEKKHGNSTTQMDTQGPTPEVGGHFTALIQMHCEP